MWPGRNRKKDNYLWHGIIPILGLVYARDKKKEIENLWNDKQVKLAGLHTACLYLIAKANI